MMEHSTLTLASCLVGLALLAMPDVAAADEPAALGNSDSSAGALAAPDYQLRVVYLIPSNRAPQPGAVERVQRYMSTVRAWYAEQMDRLGHGPKVFQIETEPDGITPRINLALSSRPDSEFHDPGYGARWSKMLSGIAEAGFPPWRDGELLLVITEMQVQLADGSFDQSTVFVGGTGTGHTGVGAVTGEMLARLEQDLLTDDRDYTGIILPDAGPYPLVYGVSYPAFEGSTLSSLSSSGFGATLHELSHGFGLPHDFRNDRNFNGNLMGNGLRGFRGALFPELYPEDDTRLSSGSALILGSSRFFNPGVAFDDDLAPSVTILSQDTLIPQRGLVSIRLRAADSGSGLTGVLLARSGQIVADISLSAPEVETSISTFDYRPGFLEEWQVVALDGQGNVGRTPSVFLSVAPGHNRAPVPFVDAHPSLAGVGETIRFDAGRSEDPDGVASTLTVEWDLEGDGIFDTVPTTEKTYLARYERAGVYQVVARLTDAVGDASVSMPFGIRIEQRNSPPDCSRAAPNRTVLWPANHRFDRIDIRGVTDPDGEAVDLTVDAIYQDEPVSGQGSGNSAPDANGIGMATAELRAERSGAGDGRVYHVFFTATDDQGATCRGEVTVSVPHDARGRAAADGGARYVSTVR